LLERFQQTLLGGFIQTARRTMPLLNSISLSALPLLPTNLLGPTKADAKHTGKLRLTPLAATVCGQKFTT
jgi:hypothetical protein